MQDSTQPQSSTVAFTTANIDQSKARTDRNYFVRVIKSPLLRFLLRTKIIKEKPAPEEKPAEQKIQASQPAPAPVRLPQLRMTIRISALVAEKRKRDRKKFFAIIILSVLLAAALGVILYLLFR